MKRVNIVAMGDVGITLATGLVLLGGDCVSEIGVYDVNESMAERAVFELNQIAWPFNAQRLPPVYRVSGGELFDCDVFVFCATVGVPAISENVRDVRMAQLDGNAGILSQYAKMAKGFKGHFAVVSDPVDLLCRCAYYESNKDDNGRYAGNGLNASQIRGYGLGVMNARAMFYAKRDERFASYLTEGRAFGPHGEGLVIANSIENYDERISVELTNAVVDANKQMRAIGFKPYIAPALSSGALSLLLSLRGEWHYSAVYSDGIFFGCKNRETENGAEIERLTLPEALERRISIARNRLSEECARWSFS